MQSGGGQRRRVLLAILGGGVVAVVLGMVLTGRAGGGFAVAAAPDPPPPTIDVVVAATDLPPATKLTATNVRVLHETVDKGMLPADVFSSPTQVYGQYVAIRVATNAPILGTMLIANPATTQGVAASMPPLDIPAGDVALSIPLDPQKGVGGYIQAGDHIDILVDVGGGVHYGFQDVPVLRVGAPGAAAAGAASVIVVVLPRDRAAALSFILTDRTGSASVITYLLRPQSNYGQGDLGNSQPVGIGNLTQHLDG